MTTDSEGSPPVPPAPPPEGGGLELARRALASARAEAARRGQRAGTQRGARRPVEERRSGAGPDGRDPQPLGSAVEKLLADRGWREDVAVGGVIGRWAEVVGAEVAAHATPEGFADGELCIRADSTAWATQLRLLAPALMATVNTRLGSGAVTRVVVLAPAGPSWRRGGRSVKGRGPRDTYG